MGQITIRETSGAPVATVFGYVDDYRNTTKYMKDLVKWKPTTEVTHGKGSKFEVGMKAGPTTLNSVVDINARTENRTILYPRDEAALRHGAGVEQDTPSPQEAYSRFSHWRLGRPVSWDELPLNR